MADNVATTSAEDPQITFNVKAANAQKHLLTLPTTTTVADVKLKLSAPEYADVPAERQRLIYSGRVLKDHDTLASIKIKDGHTVHLVKGAESNARQNPATQGSATAAAGSTPVPQVPTNIAAGTGNNPLAGLTGARHAGFHGLPGMDMFGPDGGMGPLPNTDMIMDMMDNPAALSQLQEAMNNPQMVDMMMQSPMIRDNPMLQQMLRSEETRRMMFSPDMLRMQLQMQRAMNQHAAPRGPSFPAPGATDNTPQPSATTTGGGATATPSQSDTTGTTDPAAAGGAQPNPFASLFPGGANPFAPQQNTGNSSVNPQHNPADPLTNIFGLAPIGNADARGGDMERLTRQHPELMRVLTEVMNQDGGELSLLRGFSQAPATRRAGTGPPVPNLFTALPGAGRLGGPPPPVDNRPPEQVYETQLAQLNEMGFYEFERNVSALRRSGGNVQGAIEYLLNGGA